MKEKENNKQNLNIERIHTFEKSAKMVGIDAIKVPIRGEERLYVGVRELYKDGDEWKPSEKGCTFEAKHIDTLISAVNYALPIDSYPETEEISIIPKNSNEEIHLGLRRYMGSEYMDIRSYFKKDGQYNPSRKGVTIPPDCLEELLSGLNKFKETYRDLEVNA